MYKGEVASVCSASLALGARQSGLWPCDVNSTHFKILFINEFLFHIVKLLRFKLTGIC